MPDGNSQTKRTDIFRNYLLYVGLTESPTIYHRWSYLTSLGAVLGRKVWLAHCHFSVFPNLYCMLLGEPAVRKSTAIKIAKKLVAQSGYEYIAADKTTGTSKFLMDLEGKEQELDGAEDDNFTNRNLWGTGAGEPREVFIMADEFNDFAGTRNTDFYTTLGNLWDFDDPEKPFTQRFKNSASVSIFQPTVSLLSANTPFLFSCSFPPETIGTGFLSRIILIHGERTGRRITFPTPPDKQVGAGLAEYLKELRNRAGVDCSEEGKMELTSEAVLILDDIYQKPVIIKDTRFTNYNERRFTHLLKICLIIAAAKFKNMIEGEDVVEANTILSHADSLMPKALGEFGKAKNSDIANKIMQLLDVAVKPVTMKELGKQFSRDCGQRDLMEVVRNLIHSERVQSIHQPNGVGFLPKKSVRAEPIHVDWSFLTEEEREMR